MPNKCEKFAEPQPATEFLSFLNWNCHGLNEHKVSVMKGLFQQHHIIVITETWANKFSHYYLDSHEFF